MKLGVAGLLGAGTPEAARAVRDMGFAAVSWHLPSLEAASDRALLLRVRDAVAAEGLELCQLLPPLYPSLVHPEESTRRAGVEALAQVLRAAAVLQAGNVYVRPGSLNPGGPWTPHPENHAPETRDRLVESLRLLAPRAEESGIPLAVEGHAVSPLDTPAAVRELIDRVGSPALRFNVDPVNFVRNLDQAFHPAALVDELFDLLGDVTVCAHAKDVTVEDRLVVHIEECVPGQGYLDPALVLRRFQECCPRGAVLIEHLPPARVPEARKALEEAAERAGVRFEGPGGSGGSV